MTVRVKFKLGERWVEVEGASMASVIPELAAWEELPDTCRECDAPWKFETRTVKADNGEFELMKLICAGTPRHSTAFGHHKGGGIFYRPNEPWYTHSPDRPHQDEDYEEPAPRGNGTRSFRERTQADPPKANGKVNWPAFWRDIEAMAFKRGDVERSAPGRIPSPEWTQTGLDDLATRWAELGDPYEVEESVTRVRESYVAFPDGYPVGK